MNRFASSASDCTTASSVSSSTTKSSTTATGAAGATGTSAHTAATIGASTVGAALTRRARGLGVAFAALDVAFGAALVFAAALGFVVFRVVTMSLAFESGVPVSEAAVGAGVLFERDLLGGRRRRRRGRT